MKTINTILFAAAALLGLSSCETDADVDIPETKPKLVVTSFISPQDTSLIVRVKRSRPIFQSYDVNTSASVANASVQLTDGSTTMQLAYNSVEEYYAVSSSLFPVTAGTSYTLTVTTPEGESATATTTIPGAAPANMNLAYTYALEDSSSFNVTRRYSFDADWQDEAGQTDRYRFVSMRLEKNSQVPNDTLEMMAAIALTTDDNNDGGTIRTKLEVWTHENMGGDTSVGCDFYLIRCSPEYYLYHESLYNYNSGDPFSEPSIIYTNMTGGLGVFGGFQKMKKRVLF